MGPVIHLLGVPRISHDRASSVVLRGHKAWGLLAYLVLHRDGVSRQRLASLLFEDAQDPLATLRWNLSELRRALGDVGLGGEVVRFPIERVAYLDVEVVARGNSSEALSVPGLGHDLLEGLSFATSPSFEVWLEAERRRMHATAQAVLREGALARLASGPRPKGRNWPPGSWARTRSTRASRSCSCGVSAQRATASALRARPPRAGTSSCANSALHRDQRSKWPCTR